MTETGWEKLETSWKKILYIYNIYIQIYIIYISFIYIYISSQIIGHILTLVTFVYIPWIAMFL